MLQTSLSIQGSLLYFRFLIHFILRLNTTYKYLAPISFTDRPRDDCVTIAKEWGQAASISLANMLNLSL